MVLTDSALYMVVQHTIPTLRGFRFYLVIVQVNNIYDQITYVVFLFVFSLITTGLIISYHHFSVTKVGCHQNQESSKNIVESTLGVSNQ